MSTSLRMTITPIPLPSFIREWRYTMMLRVGSTSNSSEAGEFALTFGDFEVAITVPDDHLLMATGQLQNPAEVLTKAQLKRYQKAKKSFDKPVVISDETAARQREQSRSKKEQTWHFKATNVRDFAFASSRKFIWDAQAVKIGGRETLAQSLYPKEGNPLWEKESTKAVVNTLKTYSRYSIDYPYPHATSIHAAAIGMEYPMICFNFGRPGTDGYFSEGTKYNMIGVIIHEVGHNFFPMIVNSDERQWTWMDEGINTFLEYRTQAECYENFPFSRGPSTTIIPYMKADKKYIRPIMTNSEQVAQLGNNAYGKPATALNILRETILGPETFDKAFKTYAERWAFKHPKPADFFRTMEDASGIDLDWFWRGWFYTTDHVDIAIDTMIWYRLDQPSSEQVVMEGETQEERSGPQLAESETVIRPRTFKIMDTPEQVYWEFRDRWNEDQIRMNLKDKEIYKLRIANKGGLVMPVILEFEFVSGRKQEIRLPAEVWRMNEQWVHKVFVFEEQIKEVRLDPALETADIDTDNNVYPRKESISRFQDFRRRQ